MDLERYRILVQQDSTTEQQYATQKSLVHQLEGTVKLDQGQIDAAKVNVVYTKITAPISGRIGLRLVDPGNIVHATDTTGLAVITQIEPITVIFTIPEDNLPELLDRLRVQPHLPVEAYNREQSRKLSTGYLHHPGQPDRPQQRHHQAPGAVRQPGPRALPEPVRQCPPAPADQAGSDGGAHDRGAAGHPGDLRVRGETRSHGDGAPGQDGAQF